MATTLLAGHPCSSTSRSAKVHTNKNLRTLSHTRDHVLPQIRAGEDMDK